MIPVLGRSLFSGTDFSSLVCNDTYLLFVGQRGEKESPPRFGEVDPRSSLSPWSKVRECAPRFEVFGGLTNEDRRSSVTRSRRVRQHKDPTVKQETESECECLLGTWLLALELEPGTQGEVKDYLRTK